MNNSIGNIICKCVLPTYHISNLHNTPTHQHTDIHHIHITNNKRTSSPPPQNASCNTHQLVSGLALSSYPLQLSLVVRSKSMHTFISLATHLSTNITMQTNMLHKHTPRQEQTSPCGYIGSIDHSPSPTPYFNDQS